MPSLPTVCWQIEFCHELFVIPLKFFLIFRQKEIAVQLPCCGVLWQPCCLAVCVDIALNIVRLYKLISVNHR